MKNLLKNIPASLIQIVVLAILITTYYNLPSGFIALPDFVQQFKNLSNREVMDFIRYSFQSSVFGIVYGIVNDLTKKIYIGSTKNPSKRVYKHLVSGNNSNIHLQRSIKKYGLEAFRFLVFEVIYNPIVGMLSAADLYAAEQHYIDLFPTSQLFNISPYASGGGGPKGQAEKDLMRTRMLGVNLGRSPINKGVPLTKSIRKRMLEGSAHRSHQVEIRDELMNLVTIYPSISEAVRIEKTQKNTFIKHINEGTLWRGYRIYRVKTSKS